MLKNALNDIIKPLCIIIRIFNAEEELLLWVFGKLLLVISLGMY